MQLGLSPNCPLKHILPCVLHHWSTLTHPCLPHLINYQTLPIPTQGSSQVLLGALLVLKSLLSLSPCQAHMLTEGLSGLSYQIQLEPPPMFLQVALSSHCQFWQSCSLFLHFGGICAERNALVPPIIHSQWFSQGLPPIDSMSHLWSWLSCSLTPSQVCLMRDGLSGRSYKRQTVPPPRFCKAASLCHCWSWPLSPHLRCICWERDFLVPS